MQKMMKSKILWTFLVILILTVIISKIGLFNIPETTQTNLALPRTLIHGYPFHTQTFGSPDKPAIIVIHGGPGGDFNYLIELKRLSDQYFVVFYDQRGTGLSPRSTTMDFSIESSLNDLNDIVQFYSRGKKIILIGHSWGAMLGTAYVSKYPGSVLKAVFMEPGMLNQKSAAAFLTAISEAQKNLSFSMISNMGIAFIKSAFVKTRDDQESKDYLLTTIMGIGKGKPYQCEGESFPEGSFVRAGHLVFKEMIMPLIDHPEKFTFDFTGKLQSFRGKILLLSSECSFVGYEYQKAYHENLYPKSTIHKLIKGTGHNMITMKPDESLIIIRDFLNQGN